MKFTCDQESLRQALLITQRAVGSASTLPILENIYLEVENQGVTLAATNLEISITMRIDADVQNEGKMTLPAKTLLSWVNLAQKGPLTCTKQDGESVLLETQGSKTTIKGQSPEDFPTLPIVEKKERFTLTEKEVKKALDEVLFAADAAGSRPILTGILFTTEDEKLVLVGTDSYRLSEKRVHFKDAPEEKLRCVIPVKTLLELERILDGEGDEVIEIILSAHQILFFYKGVRLVSRLLEGEFPNYKQILPKMDGKVIQIPRQECIQTVKRVGIFARENNNNIKLFFSETTLKITTDATEMGTEESTLEYEGEKIEDQVLALNSQFLLDALMVIKEEKVEFVLGEGLNPVTIRSPKEKDFLHIIMPLKV